jgi:hypothetical protein
MFSLSRRTVVLGALVGSVTVAVPVALAQTGGGGSPADKAVAAGSTLEVIGANQTVPILSATFKTSKPTDLLMTASLECSILTALTTNNQDNSANARSGVRVWLELDGKVVPIEDVSMPPQDPDDSGNGDPATDGVNFCDREYQRTVTDQEEPEDGIDQESDYIKTKSAHAFSWVRLNAGSGMHTLELVAQFNNATTGNAAAEAIVGNRTLIIEPTKMANNAVIAENGTSTSGK